MADDNYPYAVVYSTESRTYRCATVPEISGQLRDQGRVANSYRVWKDSNKPDAKDRAWANYRDLVSMMERSPFPPKFSARGWDLRGGRVSKAEPAESVLLYVGRDPSDHTRSDIVHW